MLQLAKSKTMNDFFFLWDGTFLHLHADTTKTANKCISDVKSISLKIEKATKIIAVA